MKTYYRANEISKKKILKKWKNSQTIWSIGSKVITILSILCVVACIGIYFTVMSGAGELNQSSGVSIQLIAIMLAAVFAVVTLVIFQFIFFKIYYKALDPYYKLTNECIYLKEDKLIIASHNNMSKAVESVDEYCMSYDKIKEIQLDNFYKQLTISGQIDRTYYTDYSLGKVGKQWPSDKEGKIKLLLYYENENMFLEGLTDKTKLQIKQNSAV